MLRRSKVPGEAAKVALPLQRPAKLRRLLYHYNHYSEGCFTTQLSMIASLRDALSWQGLTIRLEERWQCRVPRAQDFGSRVGRDAAEELPKRSSAPPARQDLRADEDDLWLERSDCDCRVPADRVSILGDPEGNELLQEVRGAIWRKLCDVEVQRMAEHSAELSRPRCKVVRVRWIPREEEEQFPEQSVTKETEEETVGGWDSKTKNFGIRRDRA